MQNQHPTLPPPPPTQPQQQEVKPELASQPNQTSINNPTSTFGVILAITKGSNEDHGNKRQRKEHMRRVHHLTTEGPHKNSQRSHIPITFNSTYLKLRDYPHTDVMVFETSLAGWAVTRILVDTDSSVDILVASTFNNMKLNRNLLQPSGRPLYGFNGKQVKAIGKITLPVTFKDQNNSRTEHITFDVVDMLYNYNAIFG